MKVTSLNIYTDEELLVTLSMRNDLTEAEIELMQRYRIALDHIAELEDALYDKDVQAFVDDQKQGDLYGDDTRGQSQGSS